ncbi:peptidase S10, serine carboxypeptidase [Auriculariales sp. MPI-PUGE-AT-0066]|nr:peptidase S10, serine carboxypeptidase [Auriculariales sp. MPI-PUGE-AT-0066]
MVINVLLAIGVLASQLRFLDKTNDVHAFGRELSPLPADMFTTFTHPAYPVHKMRIKHLEDLCENAYSGYIDIEARHLFFYFFESRTNVNLDPVVMWINGVGPGCSSSLGAFMELGPCNIHEHGPKYNPHWVIILSITSDLNSTIFFLDQPVNAGFSYADHGERVTTTDEAAVDVAAFVAIFFETFSEFRGGAFHMAGESYTGRYLPVFASAVYDANVLALRKVAPLTSVLIGNGITDFTSCSLLISFQRLLTHPNRMYSSYYDIMCTTASVDPILPISDCVRLKQTVRHFCLLAWIKQSCIDKFDAIACHEAEDFCGVETGQKFWSTTENPYDISRDCEVTCLSLLRLLLCRHIKAWLDLPAVRHSLGVSPKVGNFSSCSIPVVLDFMAAGDDLHTSNDYVVELLERGIRMLVYVGNYDCVCNWISNLAWMNSLEWTLGVGFTFWELQEWFINCSRAGLTKSARYEA